MSDDDFEYDFEDEVSLDVDEKNIGGKKMDWLKMESTGQIVRCSFVYFHTYDANTVQAALKKARKTGENLDKDAVVALAREALAKRAKELDKEVDQLTPAEKLDIAVAHFKTFKASFSEREGIGYIVSRLGKDGPEADAVWKRLPEPKPYFSTLLLIYPTDKEGNLSASAFKEQIQEEKINLMPWRFTGRTYDRIWKLNAGLRENGLTLASQDIQLECKEVQYQNIEVSFAGAAIWKKNPKIVDAVLKAALPLYEKLMPFKELSTEQLKEKLGLLGSASEDTSTDEFQDMLANV